MAFRKWKCHTFFFHSAWLSHSVECCTWKSMKDKEKSIWLVRWKVMGDFSRWHQWRKKNHIKSLKVNFRTDKNAVDGVCLHENLSLFVCDWLWNSGAKSLFNYTHSNALPVNHLLNNSFNYIKTLNAVFFFLRVVLDALPPARLMLTNPVVTVPSNEASTTTEAIIYTGRMEFIWSCMHPTVSQQTHSLRIGIEYPANNFNITINKI